MSEKSSRLSNELEARFQEWYSRMSKANKLDPNPDDERHEYDWRGYFRDEVLRSPTDPDVVFGKAQEDHGGQRRFPDTYKKRSYDTKARDEAQREGKEYAK